ncbi:RNA-guided endonuclease InsQ/TnpB family protein [Campylobacter upsaliensis]|uniref:RNA-guided endonuclease InsQ/TnpB family protein n=1 Tax=Campylobacter upsaliensis TaxID=28080 RepID=UPI00214A47BA|nr:transposase [Campylobacter upsaliensis]MCR2116218.1 transposase [Campylobacter upsaliensis]
MQITKGFKYRIYPNEEQQALINHQCFIYNQAYNICLNLQKEQWEKNKDLDKKERTYLKASEIDSKVKELLKQRELSYKSVTTQQARINANRALEQALKDKNKDFPKFKNSKFAKQSFNWNNQGYQIKDDENPKFKIFRLMNTALKMRYHRELPKEYKLNQITILKSHNKYFVSFSITYENKVLLMSKENLNINKAIGIDLNINDIALSNKELIPTNSKNFNSAKYSKIFKRLQRKQSRRFLKSKKEKTKLGVNFKKTQQRLNKIYEKSTNIKSDYYHKITSKLSNEFDLIVVEDLKTKNMTKRVKLKNVKAKSGLNRSILNTSFYQFTQMLEYKLRHNGKFFVKVNPQYTSKTCNVCGNVKDNLTLKDRKYICEKCGNAIHRDINASLNILERGLKSFGLGISLEDYKLKAFRVS